MTAHKLILSNQAHRAHRMSGATRLVVHKLCSHAPPNLVQRRRGKPMQAELERLEWYRDPARS